MPKTVKLDQWEKAMQPAKELGELALENTEKLIAINVASFQDLTRLGLDNLKAAMEIKDASGFQAFAANQREFAQSLAAKMAEDGKAVLELGNGYTAAARKIFQESASELTQEVSKKAA